MDAIRLLMISVNPASQIAWSQPHKWLSRASIQIDRNLGKCVASMNIHIISPFLNEKRYAEMSSSCPVAADPDRHPDRLAG